MGELVCGHVYGLLSPVERFILQYTSTAAGGFMTIKMDDKEILFIVNTP
jgi:hypothetical protein